MSIETLKIEFVVLSIIEKSQRAGDWKDIYLFNYESIQWVHIASFNQSPKEWETIEKQPLEVFAKKGALINFEKFTGQTPVLESLF